MLERDSSAVQRHAAEPIPGAALVIERIEGERVADGGEMGANLVEPAGGGMDFQPGDRAAIFFDLVFGEGWFPTPDDHASFGPLAAGSDLQGNPAGAIRHATFHDRVVPFIDGARFKLVVERLAGLRGFREKHDAAGVAIEAMQRPYAGAGVRLGGGQQRIFRRRECAGDHEHARRLIHRQNMLILVNNR